MSFYLDANVLIGIIEPAVPLNDQQVSFVAALQSGRLEAVTSEITLAECLVKPFATGDVETVAAYRDAFARGAAIQSIPVSREILVRAVQRRSETRMLLIDAIHVATAELSGCSVLISEDSRIRVPPGLRLLRWTGSHLDD